MTDPVIVAAAYLLLNGQVATPPPTPVAVPINCPAFEDEPHARHVRNHLSIRWRPQPAPPRHRRHHR
jgi:hypothetical protein